jgi:DNA-binding transcriptional LysR family regulator
VALTGAGHALAERAAAIVDVLASARTDLDRMAGSVTGPVSVAAVASAAATLVSEGVVSLRAEQPGVEVSVSVAEPIAALAMLLADDVDIAVVDEYDYVPLALPDYLVARELCAESLVVVGARGTLAKTVTLRSLDDHDWVMPPDTAACGHAVRSACRADGFEPRVRWETDDMLLLVRAVAAGHGISVLPRMAVVEDVADVDVRPLRSPPLRRRISALTRSSVSKRPVVQAVLDALGPRNRD